MAVASNPRPRLDPRALLERARAYADEHRLLLPAVGLVIAALVAYSYTLTTMFDYLALETPLAYLPLLPIFALGLAIFTARRYRNLPQPSRDRQIDLILAIPILAVAIALITVIPAIASTYYWTDRADVLSLAFFVAAGIILLYGTTWFWRLRSSIFFLLLMWPALYLHLLNGVMQSFAGATNGALAWIAQHISALGVTQAAGEGNLLITPLHGAPVLINVGTACSGADSVLGFVLIGGAITVAMRKAPARKLLWMGCGIALCFAFNVIRLVSILALVRTGHADLALVGYHAVIGLVMFTIAIAIMIRLLRVCGLHVKPPVPATGVAGPAARRIMSPRRRLAGLAALAAVVGLATAADLQLAPYAAFADGSGVARVAAFPSTGLPKNLHATFQADYTWAKQYFGENSSFQRYIVSNNQNGVIYADVVRTDDRSALDAYNLQNCFLFHNYNISTSQRVDLGVGVTGLLLNYADPSTKAKWSTVSWAWPVLYKGSTYYERIALTSNLYGGSASQDPNVEPSDGLRGVFLDVINTITGGGSSEKPDPIFAKADVNLRAVAEAMVAGTLKHTS